jgi:hypothetical protein
MFLLVFGITTILVHRIVLELLGWLLHVLLNILMRSFGYYATPFPWPVSDYRVDGIAWWPPWLLGGHVRALGLCTPELAEGGRCRLGIAAVCTGSTGRRLSDVSSGLVPNKLTATIRAVTSTKRPQRFKGRSWLRASRTARSPSR